MGIEHQGRLFIPERKQLHANRLLLKIGSDSTGADVLHHLAPQIAGLMKDGFQIAVLSLGSILRGKNIRPDFAGRDETLIRQGMSGLGQPALMQDWQKELQAYGVKVAQELIDTDHINSPYCTYGPLLNWYLENDILPIINYNDARNSFETDEDAKFKDNDYTATVVADLILPGMLGFLTSVDGVYRDRQRKDKIDVVDVRHELIDDVMDSVHINDSTENGTGGILSKVMHGFQVAEDAGSWVAIANACTVNLKRLLQGTEPATYIRPNV